MKIIAIINIDVLSDGKDNLELKITSSPKLNKKTLKEIFEELLNNYDKGKNKDENIDS